MNKFTLSFIILFFLIYFLYYFINNTLILVETKEQKTICHNTALWNYNIISHLLLLISLVYLGVNFFTSAKSYNYNIKVKSYIKYKILFYFLIFIINLAFFICGIYLVIEYNYCRHGNFLLWFHCILDLINHLIIISLFIFVIVKISYLFIKNKIQNNEYFVNIENNYIVTEI